MDTADLIRRLEAALASDTLNRKDRRFVEACLPELRAGTLDAESRVELEAIAAALPDETDAHSDQRTPSAHVSGGTVHGSVVGTNLGTIIYGNDLNEQRREQLVRYLTRLANVKETLRLHGLAGKLDKGLNLPDVYVMLATEHIIISAPMNETDLAPYLNKRQSFREQPTLKPDYDREHALPHQARWFVPVAEVRNQHQYALAQVELVAEAVLKHQHLVLCGAPGSGKSTFLHYLAWVLAQRGRDQIDANTFLHGWNDHGQRRLLPVMIALRTVAGAIKQYGASAATISAALRHELTKNYDLRQPDELLDHAFATGTALVLFDGLDEVPLEATEKSADRATTVEAVRDFAQLHSSARIVVTCRIRAWTDDLAAIVNWHVATIAPLTGGQIRHFVQAWYPQLADKGAISPEQVTRYADSLLSAVFDPTRPRLREMAENPLMLTMMAYVRIEGELPRDRPALYEKILSQLLDQWDVQRDGQSLSQVIGDERIGSKEIRPLLDQLSYEAHRDTTSKDGRGRISRERLEHALSRYFRDVKVAGALEAAERCIAYFDERSGLLHPEDDGAVYSFAHLTLQEHCAGRHLLFGEGVARVMALRDDDRWREPLFLGFGVLTQEQSSVPITKDLLNNLLDHCDATGDKKARARWYRDIILAAELGVDRNWDLLTVKLGDQRMRNKVRDGIVMLLNDADHSRAAERVLLNSSLTIDPQPVTVHERIHAADLLAVIGDPRVPIAPEQWRNEPRNPTVTATGDHYWRAMPAGTYAIGGWKKDQRSALYDLPAFWLARYPITVAQYQAFMDAGGYRTERYWTPLGWQWRQQNKRTEPYFWADQMLREARNQPVYGVTWYEARAFCGWLDALLGNAEYQVRLPTEAEWEAAACGTDHTMYPWGNDPVTLERAIYKEHQMPNHPAPVGTCPLGMSAGGILDMSGNLWEWTHSMWLQHPHNSHTIVTDAEAGKYGDEKTYVSIRGASYREKSEQMFCAARVRDHPDGVFSDSYGFRCCVSPRSH